MSIVSQNTGLPKLTSLTWEIGYASDINELPSVWYPALVPGAIQLDLANALNYGVYYFAENWKDYQWMEDQYFTYRSTFKNPILGNNQTCFFLSKGIDYEFEIWFNGEKLLYQEGMFTTVRLDLSTKLNDDNELLIKIYPIPKLHQLPSDKTQASQSVKPAVSYGWDWHPRLVPVGIWDETYLAVQHKSDILDSDLNYILDNDFRSVTISKQIKGNYLKDCRYDWRINDKTGKIVLAREGIFASDDITLKGEIDNIELWWPHDHGNPHLYTMEFRLWDTDECLIQHKNSNIGFRRVELVINEGAWEEPLTFPKSQSVPPIQLQINGRAIFCKGTNWVNPEIFPGIITHDRYNELLDRAKEANFNLLRVWGGGIVNKDAFFELCDEKGIMVWQEFPLACNNYEGTAHYLKILEQESASIIHRIKGHPSLAIWCGGNELFNNWSKMTDQSHAIRLLNSQCFRIDPTTPFLATSPVMGMGHGHYVFRDPDTKKEVYEWMNQAHNTAYTEFGVPSPSSVEVLKTIMPENELWPPKPGTSWQSHHGFNAWVESTWLMPEMLADYFGEVQNLEELIANGQLVQAEGYKCIYEEARRQKPYCSMALNWCFNEPWPTSANNSLVNWPNKPKPAYYAVKNSCRPCLVSARLNKFKYSEGELFTADLWVLNDLPNDTCGGKITVKLVSENVELKLLDWEYGKLKANTNLSGPTVRCNLPSFITDRFKLLLSVDEHPEYNSDYTLLYSRNKSIKSKIKLNNL